MTNAITRYFYRDQPNQQPAERGSGFLSKLSGGVGSVASKVWGGLFTGSTQKRGLPPKVIEQIKSQQKKAKEREQERQQVRAENEANRRAYVPPRQNPNGRRRRRRQQRHAPIPPQQALAVIAPQNSSNHSYLKTAANVAIGSALILGTAYMAMPYLIATGTSSTLLALPAPALSTALTVVSNAGSTAVATGNVSGLGMAAAQAAGSFFMLAAARHVNFTVNKTALLDASDEIGVPPRFLFKAIANYKKLEIDSEFYDFLLPEEPANGETAPIPKNLINVDYNRFNKIVNEVIQFPPDSSNTVEVINNGLPASLLTEQSIGQHLKLPPPSPDPQIEVLLQDKQIERNNTAHDAQFLSHQPEASVCEELFPRTLGNFTQTLVQPRPRNFDVSLLCPAEESSGNSSALPNICDLKTSRPRLQNPNDSFRTCPILSSIDNSTTLPRSDETVSLSAPQQQQSSEETASLSSYLLPGLGIAALGAAAGRNLLPALPEQQSSQTITLKGSGGWSYEITIRGPHVGSYSQDQLKIIAQSVVSGILDTLVQKKTGIVKNGVPIEIQFPDEGGFQICEKNKQVQKSPQEESALQKESSQSKIIYSAKEDESEYSQFKEKVSKIRSVLVHPEKIARDKLNAIFMELAVHPKKKHKRPGSDVEEEE